MHKALRLLSKLPNMAYLCEGNMFCGYIHTLQILLIVVQLQWIWITKLCFKSCFFPIDAIDWSFIWSYLWIKRLASSSRYDWETARFDKQSMSTQFPVFLFPAFNCSCGYSCLQFWTSLDVLPIMQSIICPILKCTSLPM